MIKLNLKNSSINEKMILPYSEEVERIHNEMNKKSEDEKEFLGWIKLPTNYDKQEFKRIKKAAEKIKKDSDVLVVIGIGGSYLGARAVIDSLSNSFHNSLPESKRKVPQIVYAIVAYKGFCLSYSISTILAVLGGSKGICFVLASILPQNIIYIPCILALAVSGIKLYKSIMKDRRIDNIKLEIFRHIFFSLFICILFIIGSIIETYVSSNIIVSISQYL